LVTRRGLLAGAASLPFAPLSLFGQEAIDASIAIIDTPDNAGPYATSLMKQNIKVIARYYSRKPQRSLPFKNMASNMIGNLTEAEYLIRHGLSLLSVYQFQNNLPTKFLAGLPDTGSAEAEALADCAAALTQARRVSQPEGTAIYFGVDFDLTSLASDINGRLIRSSTGALETNHIIIDAVLDYFRRVKRIVGDHYAVGVYSNGFTNDLLLREGLVNYCWVSASRAFEGTAEFIGSGNWHLFQHQVDKRWLLTSKGCGDGVDLDLNIQNPKVSKIGAWGVGEVSPARTKQIFDHRRFVVTKAPLVVAPGGAQVSASACQVVDGVRKPASLAWIERCASVRVFRTVGDWIEVDADEDGFPDGYCRKSQLTSDFTKMPPWERPPGR
jgi:Domain of unknown function (DUF1906)